MSPNVASFVGDTTVRIHVLGHDDRPPDAAELERMQELVRAAMRDGALGVGSLLIYAPAFYAETDELVALCKRPRRGDAAVGPGGGHDAWVERLRDPDVRERVIAEMSADTDDWENLFYAAGSADNMLLVGFMSEALKPLTGKTLAEVAARRGSSPQETALDLVIAFSADRIRDHATFAEPHQLATGTVHVLVNGGPVLRDGVHTGATPGRIVRGPGWRGDGRR